jgi:hypothetical protein
MGNRTGYAQVFVNLDEFFTVFFAPSFRALGLSLFGLTVCLFRC